MRSFGLVMAALLALTACEPVPTSANRPQPVAVTELPKDDAVVIAEGFTAPIQTEALPEPLLAIEPLPQVQSVPYDPTPDTPLMAQQRRACNREGGQLMPRSGGLFSCVLATPDAGQACASSSACQGMCLARSGTCSPLTPLFGCHEILNAAGQRETLCVD